VAGINQRQLRCVNGARASHSRRLASSPTRRTLVPLSLWLDAIVHPYRVCSWQRVITIASQHEPTAKSRSATCGSFNIDNNPRVRVACIFSPLLAFFITFFSFPFSLRVPPRYSVSSLLADYYRCAVLD